MDVKDFGYGLKRMICKCGHEVDIKKIPYIAALEKRCEELVAENIHNLEKYIEVQNKLKADNALLRKIVSNLHRDECLNGIDVELMYPVKRVLFEKLMTFTYIRVV